jgi:hypothetical protein
LFFWLILLGFLRCCRPIPVFADLLAEPAFAERLRAGRQVLWQARAASHGPEAFFTGLSIF